MTPCSGCGTFADTSAPERVAIDLGGLGDVADGDGDVVETTDHDCPRIRQLHHTVNTCTWHIGFLPQRWATAARTLRRSASATDSGSRLRATRKSTQTSRARASCTASYIEPPSRSRSGMPIRSSDGSSTSSPLSVIAIATDTAPAKLNRLPVRDGAGVGFDQQRCRPCRSARPEPHRSSRTCGASRTRSPLRHCTTSRTPQRRASSGVLVQVQRLAMHRNEDLRLHPTDQFLKLGAARMARHMHQMRAIGDDLDALLDQHD